MLYCNENMKQVQCTATHSTSHTYLIGSPVQKKKRHRRLLCYTLVALREIAALMRL